MGVCVMLMALSGFSATAQDKGGDRGGDHKGGGHGMHRGDKGDRNDRGGQGYGRRGEGKDFAAHVRHITGADSLQALKFKPAVDKTAKRLEALRTKFRQQEKLALDSLGTQLKKQLTEEQWKRWEDFRYHQSERK